MLIVFSKDSATGWMGGLRAFATHPSENSLDIGMVVWEIGRMASMLFSAFPLRITRSIGVLEKI